MLCIVLYDNIFHTATQALCTLQHLMPLLESPANRQTKCPMNPHPQQAKLSTVPAGAMWPPPQSNVIVIVSGCGSGSVLGTGVCESVKVV
jgi:hypothetical protein